MTTAESLQDLARNCDLHSADAQWSEPELVSVLARTFGLDYVDLPADDIAPEALAALPRDFVLAHGMLPYALDQGVLRVAVADPVAVDTFDVLPLLTPHQVKVALAPPAALQAAIARHYTRDEAGLRAGLVRAAETRRESGAMAAAGEDGADDAPLIRLVHELIEEGVRRRASDIHLEPLGGRCRVRYRIDGVLQEGPEPPLRLQPAVISRLKIMANLSIAEKRLPQDGRIRLEHAGRSLDLRMATLPTTHGESVVLRVLEQASLRQGLSELGLWPEDEAAYARLMAAPDGLLLVTGPTGSGKTTTLYSSLHQLNHSDRKIITVEDPVEYRLPGVNQVAVNAVTGLTFAGALRAMLRQSPNVIMVGEIRDAETAAMAVHAALTGHFVFSTLHTNDAPSAIPRLIDLGAKPFLVAAALRAVLAQRLVRRICPSCRTAYQPSPRELHALGPAAARFAGVALAHGMGCRACHGTGYHGRMGLFELLPVGAELQGMIYDHVTAARLRSRARLDGMITMREDGIRKVLAGMTTIDEVVAATVGDPL